MSKASDDFPLPLSPVITVSELRGMLTSMFFRLCTRAPVTSICSVSIICLLDSSEIRNESAIAQC